ncbi:hypothetical protein M9Y10_019621 [Tritrichomonas musculus]|uniref:Permease n=1 Tax=Tritrichomonas musculus TaxID=1915356 RepID=A0ABR2HGY0_9EUKA
MSKVLRAFDNYWHITESGSTFKKEIIGGITTFMTLAYILVVNPNIIGGNDTASRESLYIATCFASLVGTLMMTFYAKLPLAQAPGIGLNVYFATKVIHMQFGNRELTYANALFIVLISGVIFLLLTVFGVREKIVDSVPPCIKNSITAGIGLFIAFVGLLDSKIVRDAPSSLVDFAPLNALDYPFEEIWPTLLVLLNFLIMIVLCSHKVPGAILISILTGTILHFIIGFAGGYINPKNEKQMARMNKWVAEHYGVDLNQQTCVDFYLGYTSYLVDASQTIDIKDPIQAFKQWGQQSAAMVFREGWKNLFDKSRWFSDLLNIIATVLAFAMVDMFDTIGALLGTARRAGLLKEDGTFPKMGKALLCDSVATVTGTICGVATVTTYAESCAGINEGARTGFASLITAICFFVGIWLSPLAQIIPSTATTPVLMYVGVLMMESITTIDFNDLTVAVPAFMTVTMMPFTHNISIGIALGLLTHTFMRLCSAAIYGIKSCCNKRPPREQSSAEAKELDDSFEQEYNSENSNVGDEQSNNKENDPESQQEREHHEPLTYKQMAINCLKEVHPITVVIDILFLVFFFCARK